VNGVGRLDEVRAVVDSILLRQPERDRVRCGLIHLYGVSTLCTALAQRRGLDAETCAVAGMLHDISSYETGDTTAHAERSAARAEELLRGIQDFTPAEREAICRAIAVHSAKAQIDGTVAELLKDADVLQWYFVSPGTPEIHERTPRLQSVLRELGHPMGPQDARYVNLPRKRMASGALFFDERRQLLIVKPTYREGWLIPGGAVELDESPYDACVREVAEEIGIRPDMGGPLCIEYTSRQGSRTESVQLIFSGGVLPPSTVEGIRLMPGEIAEYRFCPREEAITLLVPSLGRRARWALAGHDEGRTVYLENGAEVTMGSIRH
jgi:uncharacterized protein